MTIALRSEVDGLMPTIVSAVRVDATVFRARRRLWITFWREFWGVFWGGFLEATGPGGSVRGDFSADGVLLVRWASANFDFFRGFFAFLARFLQVFVPYFALFPSMPCAYLYVSNFFPVSLAWELRSLHRRDRRERRGRQRLGKGDGKRHSLQRSGPRQRATAGAAPRPGGP